MGLAVSHCRFCQCRLNSLSRSPPVRRTVAGKKRSSTPTSAAPGKSSLIASVSAKELDKEARLQAEEQDVSQSIREVFRKLASALHPDREQDPVEHQRKTALMQKVNVAYGNRDLLQLLELQLEVEQIDQNAMNAVSEDRLKHYNKVLTEQSSELQQEIDSITFGFRANADLPIGFALSPSKVMALLQTDIKGIEQHIADLKQDIAACKNIKSLKQLLKTYQAARESSFDDDFF
jgi:hypothetical protein